MNFLVFGGTRVHRSKMYVFFHSPKQKSLKKHVLTLNCHPFLVAAKTAALVHPVPPESRKFTVQPRDELVQPVTRNFATGDLGRNSKVVLTGHEGYSVIPETAFFNLR